MHFKGNKCDPAKVVAKIEEQLKQVAPDLYPATLSIDTSADMQKGRAAINPNGGWGDLRDKELCMEISSTEPR